jgi:hypothetical protein
VAKLTGCGGSMMGNWWLSKGRGSLSKGVVVTQ